MKLRLFTLLVFGMSVTTTFGQKLPVVLLPQSATLHFLSPEPVQYVDLPQKIIAGDLPLKNLVRIKWFPDSLSEGSATPKASEAIITIAGEKFIAQYRIVRVEDNREKEIPSEIEILPEHMRPLEVDGIHFSVNQLRNYATQLLLKKADYDIAKAKAFNIYGNINHLATVGDYIFLDISYRNWSNLKFDTDELRFKIEDEKVNKASTVQSVEIKPEFVLYDNHSFRRNYRNVFVFKKFSYPGHKILKIELSEKQISGRLLNLKLKYKELLEADMF